MRKYRSAMACFSRFDPSTTLYVSGEKRSKVFFVFLEKLIPSGLCSFHQYKPRPQERIRIFLPQLGLGSAEGP